MIVTKPKHFMESAVDRRFLFFYNPKIMSVVATPVYIGTTFVIFGA